MFDKIVAHGDHYKGPAQGLGSEHGDSWPTAVGKINAAFEAFGKWIEGFDPDAKAKMTDAPITAQEVGDIVQRALQPLQDQVNKLRMEIEVANAKTEIANQLGTAVDGLTSRVDAMESFFTEAPQTTTVVEPDPVLPPPEDAPSLDPDGKPATGGDPVPQS